MKILLSPFEKAILYGTDEELKELIQQGQDVNVSDGPNIPLIHAVILGKISKVVILLDAGAQVNASDQQGQTALHQAATKNLPYIVGLLLAKSANLNAIDHHGDTPLHKAINMYEYLEGKNLDLIETLISEGADLNIDNQEKLSAQAMIEKIPDLHEILARDSQSVPLRRRRFS